MTPRRRLPVVERSCGSCTACCTIVGVAELEKPPGKPCVHEVPKVGCRIYADRPASCRTYQCLWLLGALDDQEDRPDRLGVVLDAYRLEDGSTGTVAWEAEPGGFARAKERLAPFARKWVGLVPPRPILVRWYGNAGISSFDGEALGPPPFAMKEG